MATHVRAGLQFETEAQTNRALGHSGEARMG
jgi:hypothetical protein